MPITVENSVPSPTSSSVGPRRDQIVDVTSRAVRNETPRFPVAVSVT